MTLYTSLKVCGPTYKHFLLFLKQRKQHMMLPHEKEKRHFSPRVVFGAGIKWKKPSRVSAIMYRHTQIKTLQSIKQIANLLLALKGHLICNNTGNAEKHSNERPPCEKSCLSI